MRIFAVSLAVALVGCAAEPPPGPSPAALNRLTTELAGRTAGSPVDCIPRHATSDMEVIDEQTILYRSGSTVYRNDIRGSCAGLGQPSYALVTQSFGGGQLCRGDLAQVRDLSSNSIRGSCSLGPFTPYVRR